MLRRRRMLLNSAARRRVRGGLIATGMPRQSRAGGRNAASGSRRCDLAAAVRAGSGRWRRRIDLSGGRCWPSLS